MTQSIRTLIDRMRRSGYIGMAARMERAAESAAPTVKPKRVISPTDDALSMALEIEKALIAAE